MDLSCLLPHATPLPLITCCSVTPLSFLDVSNWLGHRLRLPRSLHFSLFVCSSSREAIVSILKSHPNVVVRAVSYPDCEGFRKVHTRIQAKAFTTLGVFVGWRHSGCRVQWIIEKMGSGAVSALRSVRSVYNDRLGVSLDRFCTLGVQG